MDNGQIATLLDFLYLAATDPDAWPEFLASGGRLFRSDVAAFLAQSTVSTHYSVAAATGITEKTSQLYNEHYGAQDPWYLALANRGITKWIGPFSALCTPSQVEKTEFYNDFWRHAVPGVYSAGIIDLTPGNTSVFTLHRDRRRQDFDENETLLFQQLFPHLRRALSVHRKVTGLRQSLASAGGVVDALDVGLIGLGSNGTVRFTNAIAERLLRSGDAIALRDGRLVTCDSHTTEILANLVKTASNHVLNSNPEGSVMVGQGSHPLYLTVIAISSPRGIVSDDSTVFITITDPAAGPGARQKLLATLFHLTPSEIRVVMLLVAGFEPSEIADQTQTTAGTVRFQLKMVYRKMGVGRQSQLVRLVSRLPGNS
jgi:DNA-binding CsgD family transcriptional regulator